MTIANVDMAAAWDGEEGADWARDWEHYDRGVRHHHARLLEAAAFTDADRVLDIGCGNGQLTRDAARVAASATGVDLSSQMLARAAALSAAQGLANVRFVQADAQVHPFEQASYDVAVSRFGCMFFENPEAAFGNIAKALRPGGRLVLLVWQAVQEQEWIRAVLGALAVGRELPTPPPGAPGPFGLADPDRVRGVLAAGGFDQVTLDPQHEGFLAGADADEAVGFLTRTGMGRSLLAGLSEQDRERAVRDLRTIMAAHETPEGAVLGSACWLVRATRT